MPIMVEAGTAQFLWSEAILVKEAVHANKANNIEVVSRTAN